MESYSPSLIEKKWQRIWEEKGLYQAEESSLKNKFYVLVEFPYPSGAGLHVGHVRAWSCLDAYARKKRMEGFNVLFPIGWDAFGLPAENYALKMGVHPSKTTQENVETFKRQIKSLGLSFDWSREINTTDPKYYKWTQWIFLKLLEKGLAYRSEVAVNWCPFCKTNLADEEVLTDGTHERCGNMTEKRMQKQWLLAITKYADRLIEDLKLVDFPDKVARQQVNWIGRKEGINIKFSIFNSQFSIKEIEVFTTTPVNFGATFLVLAPEHPFVDELLSSPRHPERTAEGSPANAGQGADKQRDSSVRTPQNDEGLEKIRKYVEQARNKSEAERVIEAREKMGVFTGLYAVNHVTGKNIPIWISDFVLSNVGTGAVQGCPGHDKRDWDFAKKFGLPITRVVSNSKDSDSDINDEPFIVHVGDPGIMVNSDFLNGLDFSEAMSKTMDYFEEKDWGKRVTTYHLHDWVFSRQHYWGEPIPVVYCAACAKTTEISNFKFQISNGNGIDYAVVPVPEEQLPVELPFVERYEPSGTGESPLASMGDWVNTVCPNCGGPARRETDTMPNWAGSNWYYLAYLFADELGNKNDPGAAQDDVILASVARPESVSDFVDVFSSNKDLIDSWMPVDVYEGGYEHTTLHLLYSRFIYKFLYDIGVVPGPEPYARRRVHGIVLGPDNRKMSKSFGNVASPDEIVTKFGADSLRLYEMFMGPFAESVAWNINGVVGVYRFLSKVWTLFLSTDFSAETVDSPTRRVDVLNPSGFSSTEVSANEKTEVKVLLSKLVSKVSSDLEKMKFNTAVSAFMEYVKNLSIINSQMSINDWDVFLRIVAPFAPHLAEELYQRLHSIVILSEAKDLGDSSGRIPQNDDDRGSSQFRSVHHQSWPKIESVKSEEDLTIVVQVDGKVRDTIKISRRSGRDPDFTSGQRSKVKDQSRVEELALGSEKVKKYLENKTYKTIYVPGKVINFVTSSP